MSDNSKLIFIGIPIILMGLFLVIFPKLGWRYDWGAYKKGDKYDKTERNDSIGSGIIAIIIGVLIILAY